MLAQNFKTPEDLGLEPNLHAGFIELLRRLESGELKYVNLVEEFEKWDAYADDYDRDIKAPDKVSFNMRDWSVEVPHCGTICCLGGSVEKIMGRKLSHSEDNKLEELFYPAVPESNWNDISAEKAAGVLRHYLTTGEVDWGT